MARVAIFTRHLAGSQPVPSGVLIEKPEDAKCSDYNFESHAREEFENHKRRFCKNFVEFHNAQWYMDIVSEGY
jgi:hypothetical protein